MIHITADEGYTITSYRADAAYIIGLIIQNWYFSQFQIKKEIVYRFKKSQSLCILWHCNKTKQNKTSNFLHEITA